MGRWPTTRCSQRRGSSRWSGSPTGRRSTRRWVSTPERNLVPGAEISSGSLGHGIPLAGGTALGVAAQGLDSRVVVLVGDAELDEGSNHEAIELVGALGLRNLTVVVVDNASSTYNRPGQVERRFHTEGWPTHAVDGRDHAQLREALRDHERPTVVVAHVERKS